MLTAQIPTFSYDLPEKSNIHPEIRTGGIKEKQGRSKAFFTACSKRNERETASMNECWEEEDEQKSAWMRHQISKATGAEMKFIN